MNIELVRVFTCTDKALVNINVHVFKLFCIDGYQPRHGHMDMDFFMDREDFLEYPEHLLHGYERGLS